MDALFEGAVWSDEVDKQPCELRKFLHYASATGKLYVAGEDGNIRYSEIRQHLLSGEWAGQGAETASSSCPPPSVTALQPTPETDLTVTSFSLNRPGTHAFLAGPTVTDPELSAVFVLDLSARRHHSSSSGGVGDVPAAPLDPLLFSTHPGLRILQGVWHPDSDYHVALLTTDATWRLYNIHRPELAEQTFELRAGQRRTLGLGSSQDASGAPVAFSFGRGEGWDRFSVYFLHENGAVSTLCPVAPFKARYPARIVETLRESLETAGATPGPFSGQGEDNEESSETAAAWIQRAFCPVGSLLSAGSPGAPALEACQPHSLDEHSPLLWGPVPVVSADGDSSPFRAQGRAQDLLMWRFGGACTAAAIAWSGGAITAYIVAGGAGPRWHASAPQCVADESELRAVRYQSGGGETRDFNERERSGPPALQLLLLDVVQLAAPPVDNDYYDNEEDGESSPTVASRKISLQLDRAFQDTLYCIHPAKAYAVEFPWLPVVADHLLAAADGDAARGELMPALPAPKIEEVMSSVPGILDGVAVGDALCDSALIVVQADGSHACLRPRHASSGFKTPGGTSSSHGDVTADEAAASLRNAISDVEAHIQKAYAAAFKGPRAAKLPVPSGEGASGPGGQRVLVESVAELRSTHVEYIHECHHDLMQRLEQIQAEVRSQVDRAERLSAMAADVDATRDRLAAGLKRSAWLADNLSRRHHLLAELHWALPRPRSAAEVAFMREELPGMEEAARRLGDEVAAVCGRVEHLRRQRDAFGGKKVQSGVGEGHQQSLPPTQLRRVREMLAEHDRAIEAAKRQAAVLEQAVSAASGA